MSEQKRVIRVLFIDDDVDMQELIDMALSAAGFEVIRAVNGLEAQTILLDPIQRAAIDVIMVDLMMPVMDGLRFLRWLHEEAKLTIPALVLTGLIGEDMVNGVKQVGGNTLLFKPTEISEIVAQLRLLVSP